MTTPLSDYLLDCYLDSWAAYIWHTHGVDAYYEFLDWIDEVYA